MKTIKPLHLLTLLCLLFVFAPVQSQDVGGIIKRKVKSRVDRKVNETVDDGLDVIEDEIEGKDSDDTNDDNTNSTNTNGTNNGSTSGTEVVIKTINKGFINTSNLFFADDFNNEKVGEFPSKWTLLSGTLQNSQVVALGNKEGVAQFITSSRIKPTFKNDDYLGDSFKIELQCYFHRRGNEAYSINLMNNNKARSSYSVTIRSDGVIPNGNSMQYARMPHTPPVGWRTVQLSFNKGTLKVFYEGYQLINIPDLNKGDDKHLKEFTHLELKALSHGSGEFDSMLNYVLISHGGLPLYKKLMEEGRIVSRDILFEVNSYTLKPSSYESLDKIATMLLAHPELSINIEGHTDTDGSLKSNQTLSENRATAVKKYLISKNVPASNLMSVGYGEEKPVDSANTTDAKALNRRVEFVLNK